MLALPGFVRNQVQSSALLGPLAITPINSTNRFRIYHFAIILLSWWVSTFWCPSWQNKEIETKLKRAKKVSVFVSIYYDLGDIACTTRTTTSLVLPAERILSFCALYVVCILFMFHLFSKGVDHGIGQNSTTNWSTEWRMDGVDIEVNSEAVGIESIQRQDREAFVFEVL